MAREKSSLANGDPLGHDLTPRRIAVDSLRPLGNETRRHEPGQIRKLAHSISTFGLVLPVVVDSQMRVIAGWAIVQAARRLELTHVPCIAVAGLSEAQLRALRLALNRLAEDSKWDRDALKAELTEILSVDLSFDLTETGFEMAEIDEIMLEDSGDWADLLPPVPADSVSRSGDLWLLGEHRLLCGDSLKADSFKKLMGDRRAQMVFTDPPWNIPIRGHVSGLGSISHDDFAFASGEMSSEEFTGFLTTAFRHMAEYSDDGSLHFVFMDWRQTAEIMAAGSAVFSACKNLCIWNKMTGGMGSLYRSQHELVFVWKHGNKPHRNNIELGRAGRNRSNVWDYAGMNSFGAGRAEDLALHPTVKPVKLVADAILDVTKSGDILLDPPHI